MKFLHRRKRIKIAKRFAKHAGLSMLAGILAGSLAALIRAAL